VLPCAGFSNYTTLTHSSRQEYLPESIIDFVRTGVRKVFAFEKYLRASAVFRQTLGMK
jgi:hypothetical protein